MSYNVVLVCRFLAHEVESCATAAANQGLPSQSLSVNKKMNPYIIIIIIIVIVVIYLRLPSSTVFCCLLPSLPSRPSLPPLLSLPSLPSSTFFYLLYLLLSSSTFSIFSTCSTLFNLLLPSSTFSTFSTFPIASYLLLPHRPSSTFFQLLLPSSIVFYLPYLIHLLYHPYRLHLLYHLVVAPFSIITCTVGVPSSHYYLGSLSRTSRTFYFPDSQDLLNVLGGPLGELQH